MLTRLRVRNFKMFDDVDIELGNAVVLIGPNNSGKTTALQALALWEIGLRRWNEKRRKKSSPEKRPGVAINRRDIFSIPAPSARLLWHDLRIRDVRRIEEEGKKRQSTDNIRIDIIVDGATNDKAWSCGFEFDYANEESLYCRPLRINGGSGRMPVPDQAAGTSVAFLPPMSGLADREFVKQAGEIGVLIGQGQTAQVLRNLCYQIHQDEASGRWKDLVKHIKDMFGVTLLEPMHISERSEITMVYQDASNNELDLASSGRGLQQTLLLLAHLYSNPGSILLLDEPDAHLEILRQQQTYHLLAQVAKQQGSQIIAASHSEVVLREAVELKDTVISFVGKPHRINDRGTQLLKALKDIGFEHYSLAEITGWVLFLENSTDLAVLQEFAKILGHDARQHLERPYVKYVETNLPHKARNHFFGLQEAKRDLVGIALFDRLDKELQPTASLNEMMWSRREIENYFCMEEVLIAYAGYGISDDLVGRPIIERREKIMRECIDELTKALEALDKPAPWSADIKVTDDFLEPLFKKFFKKLDSPLELRKSDYHVLASLTPPEKLDKEITEKLDAILAVANKAKPRTD